MDNPARLLEIIFSLMPAFFLLPMGAILLFFPGYLKGKVSAWSPKRRKVTATILILIALLNALTLLW